jgi:CheY-like chemotaxis protein
VETDQRVLLVDDEEDVLETVSAYLSGRGYRVATASKWTEAIAELQEAEPDIVLLDLDLPTVQGAALLEFIRESHRELPVVIVSAETDAHTLERLSALGANGFVRKPFDAEDLLVVVEQALIDQAGALGDTSAAGGQPPDTDARPPAIASTPRKAAVLPGAGVETLEPPRRPATLQHSRRHVRKRRGGRRSRRLWRYLFAALLCVMIGLMLWALSDTLSSGFLGIGIR